MKYVASICVVLALSIAAYGQQPSTGPQVVTPKPNPAGQRLQQLRKQAEELEQAGHRDQAAVVRQQADQEGQALMRRLDALQAEVEQVRQAIGTGTQVVMHLEVVEVSLTKLQRLGFDLSRVTGDGDAKANIDRASFNAQWLAITKDDNKTQQLLEALRKDNLASVISDPTMVTVSGRTTSFNSGYELPVPKAQKDGLVSIEYPFVGTLVELTPEVLGNKVNLAFRCRLTELDDTHSVRVGKEIVPGVQSREIATRVELKSGQTQVFGGPIQVTRERWMKGVPWISEIPYVGAMFASQEETRNEVATFFLVRPEIVQSLPATAAHPAPGPQGGVAAAAYLAPASQGAAAAPQIVRPVNGSNQAPSATARRPADGEPRR